jgi:hypothetical protein
MTFHKGVQKQKGRGKQSEPRLIWFTSNNSVASSATPIGHVFVDGLNKNGPTTSVDIVSMPNGSLVLTVVSTNDGDNAPHSCRQRGPKGSERQGHLGLRAIMNDCFHSEEPKRRHALFWLLGTVRALAFLLALPCC